MRHILLLVIVSMLPVRTSVQAQDCKDTPPAGFRPFEAQRRGAWDREWAFSRTNGRLAPLRRLDYSRDKPPTRWPIRLDDGTRGMLSVVARPCERGDDCTPYDCGCTLSDESFWIEIRRANGQVLMRKHLWAAYQEFHLFAVDIVGGPGDELLIARIPGHASPPHGWELKIWSLTPAREIGTMHVSRGSLARFLTPVPGGWPH